jgi:hypothetical protein
MPDGTEQIDSSLLLARLQQLFEQRAGLFFLATAPLTPSRLGLKLAFK